MSVAIYAAQAITVQLSRGYLKLTVLSSKVNTKVNLQQMSHEEGGVIGLGYNIVLLNLNYKRADAHRQDTDPDNRLIFRQHPSLRFAPHVYLLARHIQHSASDGVHTACNIVEAA